MVFAELNLPDILPALKGRGGCQIGVHSLAAPQAPKGALRFQGVVSPAAVIVVFKIWHAADGDLAVVCLVHVLI